ncbi:MAG: rhomboid family intramembrane serine protease [Planctomycetaceae bacterium]
MTRDSSMGLDNREYLRDESARWSDEGGGRPGGPSFGSHVPTCRNVLFITIGVFVLQMLTMQDGVSTVQTWLQMHSSKVFTGQIWRLITCAFCHDPRDITHILFNMLFLWWFGTRLETMYGSREFLLFYLTAALIASLAYIGLDLVTGDQRPMVGASGAIMAVVMLYALHFPTQVIYIMFVLPLQIRWMVVIYAVFDLYPVLQQLSGDGPHDRVAHAAHLGGLAFGYFYGKQHFRLLPHVSGIETWWKARRRGFKVVGTDAEPEPSRKTQKLADEMDAILQKISEKGEASLTSSERRTLERASRELRERRR